MDGNESRNVIPPALPTAAHGKPESKESNPQRKYSLRSATLEDAKFLFDVKIEAMSKVHEALHPGDAMDMDKEFEKYMQTFEPGKVSVIEYEGEDVGRFRVVRSDEAIYVGGLQILPEFQQKGIGSQIFDDLIEESNRTHVPIITEIHHVNKINIAWKEKLGFKEIERSDRQVVMRYN